MKNTVLPAWIAGGAAMALPIAAAFAHGGATGIVGERMMGMMMLGEQVKLLSPLLASQSASPAVVKEAAGMIRMHAGSAMTDLFPEGSIDGPSEARPEIWERWQEFADYANRLGELGTELELSTMPRVGVQTSPPGVGSPQLSEWESIDFADLMGLPTAISIDSLISASVRETVGQPVPRAPQQVFAEITATCSSCHAAFRR